MFQSSIFTCDGTAWDPYRVRNFLTISVDDKNVLSNIPEWSKEKESSCVAEIEKDKLSFSEIQFVDGTVTKTQITSKKLKLSKGKKSSSVAEIEEDKPSVLAIQSVHTTESEKRITVEEIASKREILKSVLQFEAISNLKGKYSFSSIGGNHIPLNKCKSLFCINNIKLPSLQLTRSSSLPNLTKSTECLLSKVSIQNHLMENFNLNQTYTVEYQQLKNNFKDVEVLKDNQCEYSNKDSVGVIPTNNLTEMEVNKRIILDSTDKCSNMEYNSHLRKTAFRINEHKMNGEDLNVNSDIDVSNQDELQDKFTKSTAEHFQVDEKKSDISPENISLNGELLVNKNAPETLTIENKTSVSMLVQESKSDVRQDDSMISQEIPCAQPISSDLNPLSLLGASSQSDQEVCAVQSTDLKGHSQIVAVNVENFVKSAEVMPQLSEKVPEVKVSRKRKHTKDKSRKNSSGSKSSRKPDIYYSKPELEKILSSLKLCLRLL